MSTKDPAGPPEDAAPTVPAWGTAPGAEGPGEPAAGAAAPAPAEAAPAPTEPDPGGGSGQASDDPEPAATAAPVLSTAGRSAARRWDGAAVVAACAGVLLVVAALATEVASSWRGWAHVGVPYALAGVAVLVVGALARRRGARGARTLVALLTGTAVLTAWVTVDVVPSFGPGYAVATSLRGYPLGSGGGEDGVRIGAAADRVWFGESVRYDDGLVVSVSAPRPYTLSEYATEREDDHPHYVRIRVRVTNGTSRVVDPRDLEIQPVSGGLVPRRVYDFAPDALLERPDTIERGTSGEWDVVYTVYDPEDVTVAVEPAWASYAVAVFSW